MQRRVSVAGVGRRWVKGQSGNPKGGPRRAKSITEALRKAVRERLEDGDTYQAKFVAHLISIALDPDGQVALPALKYAIDRMEGSPITVDKLAELEQATSGRGVTVEIVRRDAGDAGSSTEAV